jgi:opacity protein-like surface antigen
MKKLLLAALMACSVSAFAQTAEKNGTIYKKHPLIDVSNSLGTLYAKGDAEGLAKLYADSAKFYGPGSDKAVTLAQEKEFWKQVFNEWTDIKITTQGYPDGLDYTKEGFTVQSWFSFSATNKKTQKTAKTNMVSFLSFNKDGKITSDLIYYDPTPIVAATQ